MATFNLRGKLTVDVANARGLANRELIGKMDPYVELFLSGSKEKLKTRIAKGGHQNPTFDQSFIFNLEGREELFHINVWNDCLTGDDNIGRLDVQLDALDLSGTKRWYQLMDRNNFSKVTGEICLAITFEGNGLPENSYAFKTHQQRISGEGASHSAAASAPVVAAAPAPAPVVAPTPAPAPAPVMPTVTPVMQPPPQPQPIYSQPPPQPQPIYSQPPPQQPMYAQPQQPMYAQPPMQQPMYAPPPQPMPMYQQPAPMYQAPPQPIYSAPPPVYAQPQVVYQAPPQPVYVQQQPSVVYTTSVQQPNVIYTQAQPQIIGYYPNGQPRYAGQ